MSEPILQARSLHKKFPIYGSMGKLGKPASYVHALKEVSFHLNEGETYGLVGESGSGKTTIGRTILGLTPADGGQILYQDADILNLKAKEYLPYRKEIQFVFQDSFSSLNPRKRIGQILAEPLGIHHYGSKAEIQERVFDMLQTVGLLPEHYFRYPHEFSGGQRQRVNLARALILRPKIIVCDEPVSALDVSIQAQILNLLRRLQDKMNLTVLFITHDISVVRYISSRIGIMYLGSIVEEAPTDELFLHPMHPYTKALFSAIPDITKSNLVKRLLIEGEIPEVTANVQGCSFYSRCSESTEICQKQMPKQVEVSEGHFVSCYGVNGV